MNSIKKHCKGLQEAIRYQKRRHIAIQNEILEARMMLRQAPVSFVTTWLKLEVINGYWSLNDLAVILMNVYLLNQKQAIDLVYQVLEDNNLTVEL